MRNYKIKIEFLDRKQFKLVELKSKTVKLILTPRKGHIHIKLTCGRFRKSFLTNVLSLLTRDELKIVANHFYNLFSKDACLIGSEDCNYSEIFGSCWL